MAAAQDAESRPGARPGAFFRLSYLYALTGVETVYLFVSAVAPKSWLELPLGLATLFFVPGYSIGALALGTRSRWPRSLTFAFVVGWSVAVNVAVGTVLLVFHVGLPPVILGGAAFALAGGATAVWSYRALRSPESNLVSEAAERLRLTGYRPAQRVAAYTLLTLIVAVIVVIAYLASVVPNPAPGLVFSITGFGGTTSTLPPQGGVDSTLVIWVITQNNATPQTLTLDVRSMIQGTSPASFLTIPWTAPLALGNNSSAEDSITLASSQSSTVVVEFQYAQPGRYLIQFLLENIGGTVVRSTSWAIVIT